MAKENISEKVLADAKIIVGLDKEQAQSDHSKFMSKATAEVQVLIDKYNSLHDSISKAFSVSTSKIIKSGELMGQYLQGSPIDKQAQINKIKASKGAELNAIKRELAEKAIELPQNLANEKFENIYNNVMRKFSLQKSTKMDLGMSPAQINRTIVEAGIAAGKSNEQISSMLQKGEGWYTQMGKIAHRAMITVPVWMALRFAIQLVQRAFSDGLKFMIEYESALAEIRIASNASEAEVKNLGEAVMNLAARYGVIGTEALKAAKLFAQQGLTLTETLDMTRSAVISSQLLGEDISTVAEGLTSAMRAYGSSVGDSLMVVDKWMKVQKEYAVTAKDLEEGMKTAGATASAFGINIDTLNSHLVGIIETTRKTGSQAGNALVMMYTRLFTTAKDYIQTIAQVPVYETKAGEATFTNTGRYREASVVMDDLAVAFQKLDKAEQLNLATQVGSRRNSTAFIALMQNYDRVLKSRVASEKSAGTSMEALVLKQNTVQYKTQQLTSSWQQLIVTVGDTGVWKGLIDTLKDVVKGLTTIVDSTAAAKLSIRELVEEERIREMSKPNPDKEKLKRLSAYALNPELAPQYQQELRLQRLAGGMGRAGLAGFAYAGITNLFGFRGNEAKRQKDLAEAIQKIDEEDKLKNKRTELKETDEERENRIAQQAVNVIDYRASLLEQQGKTEAEILRFKIEQYEKEQELLGSAKYQLIIDKMRYEWLLKTTEIKKDQYDTEIQHNANILSIRGKDEYQVLQYIISQNIARDEALNIGRTQLELTKEQNSLEEKRLANIMAYSNELKTSFSGSINDMMSGKGNVGNLFSNVQNTMNEQYRKTVSEGFSDLIMSTGIGDVFGSSMQKLKDAFGIIGNKLEDKINLSNQYLSGILQNTAAQAGVSGARATASLTGATGTAGIGGVSGGMIGMGIRGATDWWYGARGVKQNAQGGYVVSQTATGPGGNLIQGWAEASEAQAAAARRSQNTAGIVGGGLESIMTGYNAYQSAKAGGASLAGSIMSGAGGVLFGVGAIMATKGGAVGGWGWAIAIIGVLLMIASLFMKSKKSEQTSSETKTGEQRVSSKIDITNKQLEIVNRNLVALKNTITTYILPSSVYFAEKLGLDEQFAINARRGLL